MAGWAAGGRLRRANGLALALLGAACSWAASSATARRRPGSTWAPTRSPTPRWGTATCRLRRIAGGVRWRASCWRAGTTTDLPGTHPDVDGSRLVVDSGPGFELVDVGTGAVIRTVPQGGHLPALSGDWLVYRRVASSAPRDRGLTTWPPTETRVIAHSLLRDRPGAPDVSGRGWCSPAPAGAQPVVLYRIDTRVSRGCAHRSATFHAVRGWQHRALRAADAARHAAATGSISPRTARRCCTRSRRAAGASCGRPASPAGASSSPCVRRHRDPGSTDP